MARPMLARAKDYERLLAEIIDRGYRFGRFTEPPGDEGELLLRHDVDFDVDRAHAMSLIEDGMGVRATYFFLVCSESYNLLAPENAKIVRSLRDRGHDISIHFDPTIYRDLVGGFRQERRVFESVFGVSVRCISIHRPLASMLGNDMALDGVRHTYEPAYFSRISYFADSQGQFRFGHPLQSAEFAQKRSIHLLIHPIWWITGETAPVSILNEFLGARIEGYQQHVAQNCKPYAEYRELLRSGRKGAAAA